MIVTAWSPPDGSLLAGLLASLAALGMGGRPPIGVLVPGPAEADAVRALAGGLTVEAIVAPFALEDPSPHDALLPALPQLSGRADGILTRLAPAVVPAPPYEAVRIVHLSGSSKKAPMILPGRRGGHYSTRLRYPLEIAPADEDAAAAAQDEEVEA